MRLPRPQPRFRRRLRIRWSGAQSGWRSAVTGNIGPGGLFVQSVHLPGPGRRLDVEIESPDGRPLRLVGEVVWAKRVPPGLQRLSAGGFGLRLCHAPEAWFQYCATLL